MAEVSFNSVLDTIADSPDVMGCLLLDETGHCLGTRGALSACASAQVLASGFRASFSADSAGDPLDERTLNTLKRLEGTIAVPYEDWGTLLIRQSERLTLAVLKVELTLLNHVGMVQGPREVL